jgi:hypothetical protein
VSAIITKDEARKLIENEDSGKFFTVTFVKRSNGEIRKMNCRTGVRKNLLSGELRFNPAEKGLKNVYDVRKHNYRFISLENIKRIKMNKREYEVV